jgi:hypothetical protein
LPLFITLSNSKLPSLLTGENVSRFKWPLLRDECGREGSKVCGGGIIGAGMRMRCVGVDGANRWEPD